MAKGKIQKGTEEDLKKMHERMDKEEYWRKMKERSNKNYQKYAPTFDNLYDNKIIYHERITRIVRLENIEITEEYFQAKAIQEKVILSEHKRERLIKNNTLEKVLQPKEWTFKGGWDLANISENPLRIGMPYASFVIWIEPDFVKYIEKLVEYGDDDDALKILWDR